MAAVIVSWEMTAATWKVDGKVIDLTTRGMIMGVLNVTPDSFSDGGDFYSPHDAIEHGLLMAQNGADIVDVGGESTRPGAHPVSPHEELERVLPVVSGLAQTTRVFLSIDTSKARVARAALEAGAVIINDITGGRSDPEMFALAAETGAAFIIMHMQGTPQTMQRAPVYRDVVAEVADFFWQQYELATRSGIDPLCLAFDPGIGFGKTVQHNLELLAHIGRLRIADRPLVVGVSRKSFLGKITEAPLETANATVAMTSLLRERGAQVLRVHDVAENADALRTTEALLAVSS
jgi:dihydropteroate synthase